MDAENSMNWMMAGFNFMIGIVVALVFINMIGKIEWSGVLVKSYNLLTSPLFPEMSMSIKVWMLIPPIMGLVLTKGFC